MRAKWETIGIPALVQSRSALARGNSKSGSSGGLERSFNTQRVKKLRQMRKKPYEIRPRASLNPGINERDGATTASAILVHVVGVKAGAVQNRFKA